MLRLIADLPVLAVAGLIRGCWWTLYPHTSYWRGTHEKRIQDALRKRMQWRGASVWDLGAHFGFYSVGLARLVGAQGAVAAFEPNPDASQKLERHVALNRLQQVKVFRHAASDTAARLPLIRHGVKWSTSGHLPYPGETVPEDGDALSIESVRLDALVALGVIRDPAFVKVDVEGHAAEALRGAAAALARARPVLLVAFHSPQEISGVASVLRPLGYRPASLEEESLGWDDVRVGMDCFFLPSPTR